MISRKESEKYLKIVHDLKGLYTFYDTHAHPFEIIFNELHYSKINTGNMHYSAGKSDFHPPKILDFMTDLDAKNIRAAGLFQTPEIMKKKILNQYSHTGSAVFEKHMDISGIGHVLLLSVASKKKSIESQMLEMEKMFGSDERFLFGWSVPSSIPNDEIHHNAKKSKARFNIKAIKVHPNITGIDLKSKVGKDRIEAILETSGNLKLPLIVHGGISPILKNKEAASYATLKNLQCIDWGISNYPVIIAHGGLYGYGYDKINNEDLKRLKKLISKHNNIHIDLSGLNVGPIKLLVKNVSPDRILFGSDMLYEAQWQMVVKSLYAIDKTIKHLEETFIKIAKTNPEKCFNIPING